MIPIIRTSIINLFKQIQLILFLFAIVFGLSWIFSRTVLSTIKTEANGSMELDKLLGDFDFATFTDFLLQSGNAFKPFIVLVFLMGILYLFISILLSGGILFQFKSSDKFSISEIIKNGLIHFKSFFLIFLFSLLLLVSLIFLSGMFFFIFASLAEGGNEKDYILWMIPPMIILFIFVSYVFLISDYAKVIKYENKEYTAWKAYTSSIKFVLLNPMTLMLFILVFLILFFMTAMYLVIEQKIPMTSLLSIGFIYLIQQVFVIFKIACRILNLNIAQNLYNSRLNSN